MQTLAQQARDACVAHLSCNGAPAGFDIDPTTALEDACTVPSAESLCDEVVLAPALADCQPLLQADTDDPPACDEAGGGGGTGLDESGGVDGSSSS